MESTAAGAAAGAHNSSATEHFIGSPGKRQKPVSPTVAHRSTRRAVAPTAQWGDPNIQDAMDMAAQMARAREAIDRAAIAQLEAKADILNKQLIEQKRWAEESFLHAKSSSRAYASTTASAMWRFSCSGRASS